mmetsp:Transcript_6537/g.15861  ORF Transcript_6537/g.15861 Transcript_6537/m.15861 type:complete len:270 (+) Transcript_6537:128-937(+)
MFTVDDLFKDVYKRPPGHSGTEKARKCEKNVLASVIRQTGFHNKMVEEKEMWASHKKDQEQKAKLKAKRALERQRRKRSRESSTSGRRTEGILRPKRIFIRKRDRDVEKVGDAKRNEKLNTDWGEERRKNERLREQAWKNRMNTNREDERLRKVDLDLHEDKKADSKLADSDDEGSPSDVATNASQPKGRKHVRKSPKREKKKKKKKKKSKNKERSSERSRSRDRHRDDRDRDRGRDRGRDRRRDSDRDRDRRRRERRDQRRRRRSDSR